MGHRIDAPLVGGELMPTVRVIVGLDCHQGRIVQGVRQNALRDAGDPRVLSALYEAQGADELVLLDPSATADEAGFGLGTLRQVREGLSIPLTVGGGVRHLRDVAALLDAGADKVAVGVTAAERPHLLAEMAQRHGSQCVVLTLDAAARPGGGWDVVNREGTQWLQRDAVQWAEHAEALGAGEILLTGHDREGRRQGYDLALVQAISQAVNVPVIAAGGADSPQHMLQALSAGADAVLAASIFHSGHTTVTAVKGTLQQAGLWIRPQADATAESPA
jgi:imidazoleglycerol phosphate synthase cyclase subunit